MVHQAEEHQWWGSESVPAPNILVEELMQRVGLAVIADAARSARHGCGGGQPHDCEAEEHPLRKNNPKTLFINP